MNRPSLPIIHWPASPQILAAINGESQSIIVIGVSTPNINIRNEARKRIRLALHQALGALLNRPIETIQMVSQAGQPLRLAPPDQNIGLSVTHEPGISLGAINRHGSIGIDLMDISEHSGWQTDWECVAQDYLGQHARSRIAKEQPAHRAKAFAQEWTRLEASLKCYGLPLSESTSALERQLKQCCMFDLNLPAGLIGAVATLPFYRTNQEP
jgi:4'-phosphopantetheinyl transferase